MPKCGRRNDPGTLMSIRTSRDFTQQFAPFGNHFTPTSHIKIVGGKPVYVDERADSSPVKRQNWNQLRPISDKPNHVDPRTFAALDTSRDNYSKNTVEHPHSNYSYKTVDKDHFQSHVHRKSPSQPVNPYPIVPPIHVDTTHGSPGYSNSQYRDNPSLRRDEYEQQREQRINDEKYRISNEYADRNRFPPSPIHKTYYKQSSPVDRNYNEQTFRSNNEPIPNRATHLRPPYGLNDTAFVNNKNADYTNKRVNLDNRISPSPRLSSSKEYLITKYMRQDEYLPREQIIMSPDDYQVMLKLTKKELKNFVVDKLKTIYIDLTDIDRQLSGWCSIHDLTFTLAKNKVLLPPDLTRLVAANCVSAFNQPNFVNYEKFLSVVANALDTNVDNVEPHYHKSHFLDTERNTSPITHGHNPNDREMVDLLRNVEDQLVRSNCVVDIENLRRRFQSEDRYHRGTLSIGQITDVCRKADISLHQTLIDRILAKCDRNAGGQYNWVQFVSFLEKVRPLKTGLFIPRAKRPLEYAKQYPTPTDNWPRSQEPTPSFRKHPADTPQYLDQNREQSPELQEKQSQINTLERRLGEMRQAYDHLKYQIEKPEEDQEPWFQRFLKMANAVYAQDVNNTGQLTYDQLKEVVTLYNKAYDLRIDDMKIERYIMDNYHRGHINIHPFLTKLGTDRDR